MVGEGVGVRKSNELFLTIPLFQLIRYFRENDIKAVPTMKQRQINKFINTLNQITDCLRAMYLFQDAWISCKEQS